MELLEKDEYTAGKSEYTASSRVISDTALAELAAKIRLWEYTRANS